MGLKFLYSHPNLLHYGIDFRKHFVVPESYYGKTRFLKFVSAAFIILNPLPMLSTINLNHQSDFQAGKIKNVITKGMLSAKFQTGNLTFTQQTP
ncbi:MAG: hypothetical protein A2X82_07700 [Geobacteraceae bacterium GWC2_55_20]|nr:MAG: hypothetical protein A2X82_07700 [Geobacteraceae bacterium GWC2_55_20]OGU22990.1 MAG: hypothetical protein A2X85_16030 [Geobacteraceae bacterium GWF2_54_21]